MARERYLVNAGDDTIHSHEIVPQTAKEKRENWWYHYKWHTIGIVIAVICVFSFVYSIVSKVEPDYTIALLTSYTMPSSGVSELERCITPYADDRNGDGKVKVAVTNYTISEDAVDYESLQVQQASFTRLIADITVNESMIFLHDESAFNDMQAEFEAFFLYNDGTTMPEGAEDFSNAMKNWSDIPAFESFAPETEDDDNFTGEMLNQLFNNLRVSFRACEGTSIEKKQKYIDYYEDSLELYRRLENAEPYTADGE